MIGSVMLSPAVQPPSRPGAAQLATETWLLSLVLQ
jgi:hypothetical protein